MLKSVDVEVEGVTAFAPPPASTYRYVIALKSEKVNIWLEDRCSKKQWQSGYLSKEDYVTTANVFVDASVSDYVSCFKQCLDCSLEDVNEAQRKLTPLRGGKLQLDLSLKIRLLQSARDIGYTFVLEPVAVERIDILESKLKDQQEELEKLRGRLGDTQRAYLYAESVSWASSMLMWNPLDSSNFSLSADTTSISVLLPGVYAFGLLVNHQPIESASGGSIVLQKNNAQIQQALTGATTYNDSYCGQKYCSHRSSASLMCIVQVEKHDEISVLFTGTQIISSTPSYFTAVKIGA
ncbi:hypothetical protein PHYBOEH_003375 [Phytophthora boehmeriae]|uniref:Uncharacterized protein n=1 Tax=Phytophthora boehmeriae TaxID=109152 RepID=A0A8T1WQC8_9STRA|nr:hypothetical protein PHYBOEH_003375 [Phytophthora boehmeriae]